MLCMSRYLPNGLYFTHPMLWLINALMSIRVTFLFSPVYSIEIEVLTIRVLLEKWKSW